MASMVAIVRRGVLRKFSSASKLPLRSPSCPNVCKVTSESEDYLCCMEGRVTAKCMSSQQALQYLVLFCDVETTGVRINHDHVIEIGAVVFGEAKSHVTNPTFNELIYTDVRIPQIVASLTGITDSMLIGKKRFKDVCTKFLHWIDAMSNEVLVKTGVCSVPVLVAYNGFRFDFPIMLAEIQRNSMSFVEVLNRNIHFGDPYHLLLQAKSSGMHPVLNNVPLKMDCLIDAFVPSHDYNHRALGDVTAMEKLFHLKPFSDILPNLVLRNAQEQLHYWKHRRSRKATLTDYV